METSTSAASTSPPGRPPRSLAACGTAGFRDGAGASAQFNGPNDVAIAPSGGFALVAVRA
jgi:hypothetical protein